MEELQLTLTILTSLLFLILLWSIKTIFLNHSTKRKLPPSPLKLPIIGNLHQLGSIPHRSFHSLALKHGPIMLLHFGNVPFLVVSSANSAREIMKTHDLTFASKPHFRIFKKLVYDCKDIVVGVYGDPWRKMKSILVLQLLSSKRVQNSRFIREEETALFVKKVRECSGPVNLSKMFVEFTNDSLCRSAFGRKYSVSENGKKFLQLMSEYMELLMRVDVGDFIPWLGWINRVNGLDTRIDRTAKEMDEVLEGMIQERTEAQGQELIEKNGENFVDLMLEIYNGNSDDLSIDRNSIKPLILDIFIAGTDTVSTSLGWTMTELLRHPKVMEKLQHEVRGIMKQKQGIRDDDLKNMYYLKAVIKESLRFHPPIPLLAPRIAGKDVQINGYDVSAGTVVVINAWAIGRDPLFWNEPEKFKPERFLNSSIDFKGFDFEFVPFGAGRRGCPGIAMALATMELVLANLVHKFDWKLPDNIEGKDLDMRESQGITVHRVVPLFAVASEIE